MALTRGWTTPRHAALAATVLIAASVLSGCIASDDEGLDENATLLPALGDVISFSDDGSFDVNVPVPVVLIGFDEGVGEALAASLVTEDVHHAALDLYRTFPPDPAAGAPLSGATYPIPVRPTASYHVLQAPDELTSEVLAFIATATVEGAGEDVHDANAVEAFLAERLPAYGIPVDDNAPSLILLHGRDVLAEDHAWRYTFHNGYLEPVRVFGERLPLLAMDVSARSDPYVYSGGGGPPLPLLGGSSGPAHPYDVPLGTGGDDVVAALDEAARDATHYRILQGSIYPITTKPCHAVTLVLGLRATALTETLPDYERAEDMLDLDVLDRAFENLTGPDTVEVDLKVLHLPVDDPMLDTLSRGSLATLDAFRWWLDQNWDTYWVPHEGCEPYVSFLIYGDVAEPLTFGIATYDTQRSHRISFSAIDERFRLQWHWQGPGEELLNNKPASVDHFDRIHRLFGHETGHLMGQRHPHDITTVNGGGGNDAWSSVWTTMSYQIRDRLNDFGAMDKANYERNRAAYLATAVVEAGLMDDPQFAEAQAHLAMYHWGAAGDALEAMLAQASTG